LLLEFKSRVSGFSSVDNATFIRFVEETFKPPKAEYQKITSVLLDKFKEGKFPDAFVLDKEGNEKKIEFKLVSSDFGYPSDKRDYIVCWRNDKENRTTRKLTQLPH